jgi:hypothetical protein
LDADAEAVFVSKLAYDNPAVAESTMKTTMAKANNNFRITLELISMPPFSL